MTSSTFTRRLLLTALAVSATALSFGADSGMVSSMRNVNAVMESRGFRINPAFNAGTAMTDGDLAPPQAFEIFRPEFRAFTIGRLFTSCSCIQLESPKRRFEEGERAVLQLRNIRPTPINGQIYAIYVQITNPIRVTLRFDTFVQSNVPGITDEEQDDPTKLAAMDDAEDEDAGEEDAEEADGVDILAGPESSDMIVASAGTASQADAALAAASRSVEEVREAVDQAIDASTAAPVAPATPGADDFPDVAAQAQAAYEEVMQTIGELDGEKDFPALPADPAETPTPAAPVAPAVPPPAASPIPKSGTAAQADRTQDSGAAASPAPAAPESGKNQPFVSLLTIGVKDLGRSMDFYQSLGWEMAPRGKYDQTAMFQLNGQVLVLYPVPELLKEQGMQNVSPVPGGITLAIHVRGKDEVESVYRRFIAAGGAPLKEPTEMLSGSVTGYVADPDGNPWEISWVPRFRVDGDGRLWLP